HILTGETKDRQEVVNAFQNDQNAGVFLLSLRAAGTGLNLTTASYVVLYDPWWNPAVEAQAIDRSHRIGQTRTVNAYRLIAPGTWVSNNGRWAVTAPASPPSRFFRLKNLAPLVNHIRLADLVGAAAPPGFDQIVESAEE